MKMALEFVVVFAVVIWRDISSSLLVLNNKDFVGLANNKLSNRQKTLVRFETSIATILLILYIAGNQPNGLTAIGVRLEPNEIPKLIFVGGLATGYLLLSFARPFLLSNKQREDEEKRAKVAFDLQGWSSYRNLGERLVLISVMWLGVIAEEFVYRGYLILFLAAQTGIYIPWIILSILLSIAVHLYQGVSWRQTGSHVFLAIVFIVVALTTKNLITAIIPHAIYNTIWLLRGWIKYSKVELDQAESIV